MRTKAWLVLAMLGALLLPSPVALASSGTGDAVVLAQEGEGGGGGNRLRERSEEEAEADEQSGGVEDNNTQQEAGDEAEEEAVEEAGPPWTYQMARLSLGILVLLGLAVAGAYYRFVVQRQRGIV